ncbi:MAG: hypothetical protein ACRCXB_30945 [Aeromonadaceae bacterium]
MEIARIIWHPTDYAIVLIDDADSVGDESQGKGGFMLGDYLVARQKNLNLSTCDAQKLVDLALFTPGDSRLSQSGIDE